MATRWLNFEHLIEPAKNDTRQNATQHDGLTSVFPPRGTPQQQQARAGIYLSAGFASTPETSCQGAPPHAPVSHLAWTPQNCRCRSTVRAQDGSIEDCVQTVSPLSRVNLLTVTSTVRRGGVRARHTHTQHKQTHSHKQGTYIHTNKAYARHTQGTHSVLAHSCLTAIPQLVKENEIRKAKGPRVMLRVPNPLNTMA